MASEPSVASARYQATGTPAAAESCARSVVFPYPAGAMARVARRSPSPPRRPVSRTRANAPRFGGETFARGTGGRTADIATSVGLRAVAGRRASYLNALKIGRAHV